MSLFSKIKYNYGYLYAPEDGVIASVTAEVDENVSPGQEIGVLNAGTAIEISLVCQNLLLMR